MKHKLLIWLKLTLFLAAMIAIALASLGFIIGVIYHIDLAFLSALVVMLLVYGLPYCMLYALVMMLVNVCRNLNGLMKSVACGLVIGFASIFVSESIWGDGHTEMWAAWLAAVAAGIVGAIATLFLPKPD